MKDAGMRKKMGEQERRREKMWKDESRDGFGKGGEEMKWEVRSGERRRDREKSSQMFLNAANLHPNK